jgi:hypothetical protein
MINFRFALSNPWRDNWDMIYGKSKLLTKHKAIEVNVYKSSDILEIDFFLKTRCDHAGIRFMFGLFGINLELYMYDIRHWDYDNKTWEVYEGEYK